jgi:hypothetical protein
MTECLILPFVKQAHIYQKIDIEMPTAGRTGVSAVLLYFVGIYKILYLFFGDILIY